ERVEALAFEIENGVDDVLENARSRDGTLFRHVTDEEDRHVVALCDLEQACGALAQLRDATRGRADRVGRHRLDRVDHREDRTDAADGFHHRPEVGLGQDEDGRALDPEAAWALLYLRGRLLAGYMKDSAALREGGRRLHQQR